MATFYAVYQYQVIRLLNLRIDASSPIERHEIIRYGTRLELKYDWVVIGIVAVIGHTDEAAAPGCTPGGAGVEECNISISSVPAVFS